MIQRFIKNRKLAILMIFIMSFFNESQIQTNWTSISLLLVFPLFFFAISFFPSLFSKTEKGSASIFNNITYVLFGLWFFGFFLSQYLMGV
tara:strand:- start:427 stop:696 length:270 start_codon:yes stop_codon:yes gene_type:complete